MLLKQYFMQNNIQLNRLKLKIRKLQFYDYTYFAN